MLVYLHFGIGLLRGWVFVFLMVLLYCLWWFVVGVVVLVFEAWLW